jgi:hypothetical protein
LVDLHSSRKVKGRFANDRTLEVGGIRKMVIKRKNGKSTVIENVLGVLGTKSNLLEDNMMKKYEK